MRTRFRRRETSPILAPFLLAARAGIIYHRLRAGVAELVDAADLKSAEAELHTGSIPVPGIRFEQ